MAEALTITGLAEVQQKLRDLPSLMVVKAFYEALQAGGEIMQGEVETNVPRDTGALAEHVAMQIKLDPRRGGGSAIIGFDRAVDEEGNKFQDIAFWLEYGHRMVSHGKDTGKQVAAHPFMRPAALAASEPASEAFVEKLVQQIEGMQTI